MSSDMERGNGRTPEQSLNHGLVPVFGLFRAPLDPNNDQQQLSKDLVHRLHQRLLQAQEAIKTLRAENETLRKDNERPTLKDNSTKRGKEEVEDFQKEREGLNELTRQQWEEIRSLKMKLLELQNQQMEEGTGTSERIIQEERTRVEREVASLKERLRKEMNKNKEEEAVTKLRESDLQKKVNELQKDVQEKRSFILNLIDKFNISIVDYQNTFIQLRQHQSELCEKWEDKCNAVEERHRRELDEKEESWQRRMQEMERGNEVERMWLQKEGEWRQKASSLEEEIRSLMGGQRQGPRGKKKPKLWWKRGFRFSGRPLQSRQHGVETVTLLSSSS